MNLFTTANNISDNSTDDVPQVVWIISEVSAFILLFLEVLILASLVDCIRIFSKNQYFSNVTFQILGSFAGSVIVSAGFLHLLAEGLEKFRIASENMENVPNYPWGELIVVLVIFALLINDKLISLLLNCKKNTDNNRIFQLNDSSHRSNVKQYNINNKSEITKPFISHNDLRDHYSVHLSASATHSHHHEVKVLTALGDGGLKSYTGVILVAAFSLHSIVEGIGLGTLNVYYDFLFTFLFISLHRTIAAVSIAVALLESDTFKKRKLYYLLFILFSLVEPISFAIGVLLKDFFLSDFTSSIFQCLTAGTFIFIGLKEIIPLFFDKEMSSPVEISKIIALTIGLIFVALLKLLDLD